MNPGHQYITRLYRRILLIKVLEATLWSLGIGAVAYLLLFLIGSESLVIALVFFLSCAALLSYLFTKNVNEPSLVAFLHSHYPSLQYSADLVRDTPRQLTTLERLQVEKVYDEIRRLFPTIRIPNHLPLAALVAISCMLAAGWFVRQSKVNENSKSLGYGDDTVPQVNDSTTTIAIITEWQVKVSPPSYTGKKVTTNSERNLSVAEGARIEWTLQFTNPPVKVTIHFTSGDSLEMNKTASGWKAVMVANEPRLYQVRWTFGQINTSDFYRINIVEDQPPRIEFKDLRQSLDLTLKDDPEISLQAKVSDDYGLSDLYIIATVAKGSGESVKFREEKFRFDTPGTIEGKTFSATKKINIRKLGLEPGDELYFYAEGHDNKSPKPNRARTETYFITLLDTATQELSVDAGLGVDLMPEYFRSQRQIIIDTEKLLRNKKSLSKQEFNSISNELGYDQKVLRLKYGEFLGEEFESELTENEHSEETAESGEEAGKSVEERFGHVHDKDNEHHLVDEKPSTHQHAEKSPDEKEDPLEQFVHAHDDTEEATFFIQSIRAKLKAALTEMWDAELYLRLYQPDKSLPYQYKALRLLKEISNDSRIYVHKTGFDPPPIKEEKRLTGDLSEVKTASSSGSRQLAERLPNVRQSIAIFKSKLDSNQSHFTESEKTVLQKTGVEVARISLESPQYLPLLRELQVIIEGNPGNITEDRIQKVIAALYNLLPGNLDSSPQQAEGMHKATELFLKNFERRNELR